jgi:phosphodiesterase/alkaline phosphatase D-like protein
VATNDATVVLTTSATLNGNLSSLGTASSVTVSFEWGTAAGGPYPNPLTVVPAMTVRGAFSANLTGLTPGTKCYYRAKTVGDGTPQYGAEMSFTTSSLPDTTAPVISSVNSSNITVFGATITWSTNELATSQVEYGLTEEYGSTTTLDATKVNSHSVELTDLKAGKTYHYQVISKDAANNQKVSADETFTTTSRSGGMPTWAWVLIGLAAVGVLGAAAYLIRGRLAQG